jgi:hypothetical protein
MASSRTTTPDPVRSRAAAVTEDGLIAGAIGGVSVALFFLIVDAIRGEPLFTPSLLGSVLFLDESAQTVIRVDMSMVLAYSALHFGFFLAAGMAAAFTVMEFQARPRLGAILVGLFVCFELGFLAAAVIVAPGLIGVLGAWLVVLANLLAAATMALYLLWWRAA